MNDFIHSIPKAIDLYKEGDLDGLNITKIGEYLEEKTHIPFRIRGNIYKRFSQKRIEEVSKELARIKVKDPGKRLVLGIPLQGEVDYEKRRISEPNWKIFGILYEGVLYQKIISDLVFKGRLGFTYCTILLTNQLFGTWDRDDNRYHARVSLYGFPSLISITGLVEAPAKPKEFYLKKQMGVPAELLKEEYKGRFLDYGDLRTTEVLKGYAMQAFLFHLTGDPFCGDRDCRLFNSHWQEDVLHSQMNGRYEFCPRHEKILKGLRQRIA
ncbi:MAG: DUF6775 family putative metallopeptidase [Nitrospirota bacterium]